MTFHSAPPTEEITPCCVEFNITLPAKQTTLKLDKNTPEDVFVFDVFVFDLIGPNSYKVLITQSQPYRLVFDANQDKQYQPEEIVKGKYSIEIKKYVFKHVPFPYPIQDSLKRILVEAQATIRRNNVYLDLSRIESYYEGVVEIDGSLYPARCVFRSPISQPYLANELIILDENRDGKFHWFIDPWFSANGVAYWKNNLWTVKTILSQTEAKISLTPYTGPTGKLKIAGNGIHRFYLQCQQLSHINDKLYEVCLTYQKDQLYTLPVSQYQITSAWLCFPPLSKWYIQLDRTYFPPTPPENFIADVKSDQTTTISLGGPLKKQLQVDTHPLAGFVSLDLKGLKNSTGFHYEPAYETDILNNTRLYPPKWEIRNSHNVVIRTDQFSFG